ncbi:ABC transporter permease [Natronosporangium hydrolyticum]|uniref:ABC transporter permease n=1 Tax=Natronosporangium hydrolyticum TaxID=2811111 RepID=A0A895YC92_9ACTN|nr:ABC transporter permease [Natronosporangium hydrolyticum]QSB15407.1 ABC transporter permease [Natronosporangium hydrolyticum]
MKASMEGTATVPTAGRAGLVGALAAEWTKLWTVRTSWACLATALVLSALYPVIAGVTVRTQHAAGVEDPLLMPATAAAASGILVVGQLALLALATLVIAGEYGTGSIRTTLQCVPARARLLLAKALVVAPVLAVAGVVMASFGTALAWLAMGEQAPAVTVSELVRLVAGVAGYLALAGPLVVALGAVLRSVAGTLTAALVLMLLAPMLLDQSGIAVLTTIAAALPGSAGQVLITGGDPGPYGVAGALAVLAAWTVAAQLIAGAVMRARDG